MTHWFELVTLLLLCLNLWFVTLAVNELRETNRLVAILARLLWDEPHRPNSPTE
jgi:hypothetical protein